MDPLSIFNLTEATDNWLNKLNQRGSFTEDELLELQNHLSDGVEALQATGLTQQEAFLITSHRLGTVETLENEFSKLNRPLPFQREPVLLLLGIFGFLILKNAFETIIDYSALWFASYWRDSIVPSLLLLALCIFLLGFLLIGASKWFGRNSKIRDWFFLKIAHKPMSVIIGIASLLGFFSLCAYNGQHQFEDLLNLITTEQWSHSQLRHIHNIFWLGFYLVWLLILFQSVISFNSLTSQTLVSWIKQAPVAWQIISGLCLFTCCLGISIMCMRILAPNDGIARFYISASLCCLINILVLNQSPHRLSGKNMLVSIAPIALWYIIALGTSLLFDKKPSYLLTDWFLPKFFISAFIGVFAGVCISILANKYPLKAKEL